MSDQSGGDTKEKRSRQEGAEEAPVWDSFVRSVCVCDTLVFFSRLQTVRTGAQHGPKWIHQGNEEREGKAARAGRDSAVQCMRRWQRAMAWAVCDEQRVALCVILCVCV